MSLIKVTVDDQNLHIIDAPKIAAQGVNENYVEFTFSPHWNGFGKSALFYREEDEETVYESVVNQNGKALVPHEVTAKDGKICFGVCGVKDNVIYTSEIVKYKIVKGRYTAGEESQPPTPGIYEQMLALAGQMIEDQNDFKDDINDLLDNTPYLEYEETEDFELPIHTINDTVTGSSSTWSSEKIAGEIETKAEELSDQIEDQGTSLTNLIASSKQWILLDSYQGATNAYFPEGITELYVLVHIVYSPDLRRSIPFLIPKPIIPAEGYADVLVNHYGTDYEGYCAVAVQGSRVSLFAAYNGTDNVTANTYWDVLYR